MIKPDWTIADAVDWVAKEENLGRGRPSLKMNNIVESLGPRNTTFLADSYNRRGYLGSLVSKKMFDKFCDGRSKE